MAIFPRSKRGARGEPNAPGVAAAGAAGPTTIGAALRQARQRHGAGLDEIGATLRIRPAFLEAIEENRYDQLPGAAYALGFVRSYAEHLGLDGEAMARRFKAEVTGLEPRHDLSFPMPLSERSMPGGALLLVALIIAACAYAVWYYRASGGHDRPERIAEVPSKIVPLPPAGPGLAAPAAIPSGASPVAPAPAAAPASPAATSPPGPGAAAAPGVSPVPTAPAMAAPAGPAASAANGEGAPAAAAGPPPADGSGAAAEAAQPPAIPPPPPPQAAAPAASHVYGAISGPSRIVLRAVADSWIQVRDASQAIVAMRILRPGDLYRVPDRPGLTLATGNAGGLEIAVDGQPVVPIGASGKRRVVALDPERLRSGNAGLD